MKIACIIATILISISSVFSQKKVGLMIGISDYESQSAKEYVWSKIHGVNDVNLLSSTLSAQGFSIKTLLNETATAQNIRKELSYLTSNLSKGDIVYIHFSCHGQPIEDLDGDEDDGWDESIVPYDAKMEYIRGGYEGGNHIVDDELQSYFTKIRETVGEEGFLCVVIDACHAGASSRSESNDDNIETFSRGTKRGFSPSGKNYHPRINTSSHFEMVSQKNLSDIIILEACRSYQTNYEINEGNKYYGPLSFYINTILAKGALLPQLDWVYEVKHLMDSDIRLIRQNMVYESTIKK